MHDSRNLARMHTLPKGPKRVFVHSPAFRQRRPALSAVSPTLSACLSPSSRRTSPFLPLLCPPSFIIGKGGERIEFTFSSPNSYRAAVKQVVVAAHRRRPLCGLQLGLGGRGLAYTMGQGLRRPDRHGCQSQGDEGETAWAREHSDSETNQSGED